MRVIAGSAKGRPLRSPSSGGTRPVTDRAKESLFNILGPRLPGARFLDLFAGTGAIGIEALSRGAARATLVERSGKALADIRHNLAATGLAGRAEVAGRDVFAFLKDPPTPYDVVFAGPPQWQGLWVKAIQALAAEPGWLSEDAVVVAQHDPAESTELALRTLVAYDERTYARVRFTFFRRAPHWPDQAAVYDTVAADYAAQFGGELTGKPFDTSLLTRFAATVPAPGLVWDVGCGPAGHIAGFLAGAGAKVAGLDLSRGCATLARRYQPGLPFVVADMCRLPAADAAVAGVVAFYSAIHLPRWRLPEALDEFRRVLRPGGQALIAMHGGNDEVGADEVRVDEWFGHQVEGRATLVTMPELTGLATAAGFTVRESHIQPPSPGQFPSDRLYLWLARE